jgi:uncharacterized protein YyaL (SSP411 family)
MVFLTHEGLPFLSYCTMTPEGNDTFPSLSSLIESTATTYAENAEAFLIEARLRAQVTSSYTAPDRGTRIQRWEHLRPEMDMKHGGMNQLPKHPHPQLLWVWLEDHQRGILSADIVEWGQSTLNEMPRGAMYDQIDRGFHRCARDERWIAPHFEKIIPLNAQLVAVYSRAAAQFDNRQYRDIANQLQKFCALALSNDVDLIAADSDYYTWTSSEVVRQLDPEVIQVVALHFDIQPAEARLALRRAVEMEEMNRYSYEDVETLKARLVKGKAQMLMLRQRRPAPPTISVPALSWRAETIRWQFVASEWLKSIDVAYLETALDHLTSGRFQDGQGYLRPNSSNAWFEDQAAILAAFVTAHRATGAQHWLDRARTLADQLLANYASDVGWIDRPGTTTPSSAVTDDVIPATIPTATMALTSLSQALKDSLYAKRAAEIYAVHAAMCTAASYWSASSWDTAELAQR